MSKDEHLLEEKESWWCVECESEAHVVFGKTPMLYCNCIDDILERYSIESTPNKWIECTVRITKNDKCRKCPKCKSGNIIMFSADDDICKNCGCIMGGG